MQRFDDQEKSIIQSIENENRKVSDLESSIVKLCDNFSKTNANEHEVTRQHISTALHGLERQDREEKLERLHDSLKYQAWNHRQAEITLAHRGTSEWIFAQSGNSSHDGDQGSTDADQGSTWPNMVQWLEGKDDRTTYWISGKPAAGKSTLVKFLFMHTRTRAALDLWATLSHFEDPLLVSHFFWASGSDMQQSIAGMLRSILYQVLDRRPDLRASVLSQMLSPSLMESPASQIEWPRGILLTALQDLFVNHERLALCLFIDGLDECCDDHDELVDILQTFAQTANGRILEGLGPEFRSRRRHPLPPPDFRLRVLLQSFVADGQAVVNQVSVVIRIIKLLGANRCLLMQL